MPRYESSGFAELTRSAEENRSKTDGLVPPSGKVPLKSGRTGRRAPADDHDDRADRAGDHRHPLLARTQIPYFIDGQRLIIGLAMDQLRPAGLASGNSVGGGGSGQVFFGGHGALGIPPMPTWAMISVIVGWTASWSAIGAWRMMTRDA
jgi:hypothetical protein